MAIPIPPEVVFVYGLHRNKEGFKVFYEVCNVDKLKEYLRQSSSQDILFCLQAVDDTEFVYSEACIAVDKFIEGKHPGHCKIFSHLMKNVKEIKVENRRNWYLGADISLAGDCETCDDIRGELQEFRECFNVEGCVKGVNQGGQKRKMYKAALSRSSPKTLRMSDVSSPRSSEGDRGK